MHPLRTLAEGQDFVILTPTNAAAQRINMAYLEALAGQPRNLCRQHHGRVQRGAHPTDTVLALKPGAKVILLRNDPDRRWVNGTIARVARLEEKRVVIELDGKDHEVEPVSWEARRYAFDQAEQKIVETVAGTFKQLPLQLAWALTIHKSQGLTLDRVYVDLGQGTFAHGPDLRGAVALPLACRPGLGATAERTRHSVRPELRGLSGCVPAAYAEGSGSFFAGARCWRGPRPPSGPTA